MAVNVRGVFLVAKAVLPVMVAAHRGSIINMSSTIAEIGLARRASYAASKGAVLALTRQMQADYAAHGIRVNALLPGTIHTPFVDRYLAASYDDPAAGLEQLKARQLTGDLGTPEDVASAALFLASDESRFVLGLGPVRRRWRPRGEVAMRLATYRGPDGPRLGIIVGPAGAEAVLDAARAGRAPRVHRGADRRRAGPVARPPQGGRHDGADDAVPLERVQLLAPIARPGKIVAVGRNYREHAAEEGAAVLPRSGPVHEVPERHHGSRQRGPLACRGHRPG